MTTILEFNDCSPIAPVILPGSKSIAARALILRHVFDNYTWLSGLPECDDTRELHAAMLRLSSNPAGFTKYNLGTGGTSLRFFTALVASLPGIEAEIECSDALRRRPLSPLIDALRAAGADIEYLDQKGHAPLLVRGRQLDGTHVNVDSSVSSQFTSALMMASVLWKTSVSARTETVVSRPYIEMTEKMVSRFAERPAVYGIEGDWSAAGFFYEYALLRPGVEITVKNMPPLVDSIQGDRTCLKLFARLGVETKGISSDECKLTGNPEKIETLHRQSEPMEFYLNDTPDLTPPLVVGMCFAGIRFRITGIGHLRHKESDRIAVLAEELGKAGFTLETGTESIAWFGKRKTTEPHPLFSAHADHRIAMAIAIATVKTGKLILAGAEAVTKSFPDFYAQLSRLGLTTR